MAMNNKIGLAIVTYTINYGTFLQAFATQAVIRNLGYETEILNIDSVISDVRRSRKKYFLKQILNLPELKSYRNTFAAIIAKRLNRKYRLYITSRENCFKAFGEKYFDIGKQFTSWSDLSHHCEDFSSIIVGSDQLWRPANIAGNFYTLNFVPESVNKVSYATSFGINEIRKNQKEICKLFLNRIQYLSCREESGARIIHELTGRNAVVVADPTLLLSKNEWDRYVSNTPIIQGDYIFVYLLASNKTARHFVKNLADSSSCKIIGVLHGAGYINGDDRFVDYAPDNIGPFEFLNLIKYAKYICTDSFHGCVFSLLFEKNFFAFKRFSDKDKMSTNTRVTDLLTKFNLCDRLVEDYNSIILNEIDYTKVNESICGFRNYSMSFLMNSLNMHDVDSLC